MQRQTATMGVVTLVLCALYLLGVRGTADPEGVAVVGGLGSMVFYITSPLWLLCRRSVPLWFAFACSLIVVWVAAYGGCWSGLLSGQMFPNRPTRWEVVSTMLGNPQDCWPGLVYGVVLTAIALFQRISRWKAAHAKKRTA
jgi:hypothetical protein